MAKIVVYTSPARGHLYPVVPIGLELARRGHDVVLVTMRDEVARVEAAGLRPRAIAPAVEAVAHDDYQGTSTRTALNRAVRVFVSRAEHEVTDLKAAIAAEQPDLLLVDFNAWGACALAESTGLPWAIFMPYFLPWRLPGLPPFGPGLTPKSGVLGRVRDAVVGAAVYALVNANLPKLNAVRARVGLDGLRHMTEQGRSAPLVVYFTAEPFEYACAARPESVLMVGPGRWEPPTETPEWLATIDRPIVLVTCSTEFQDDGALVSTALEALEHEDVFVVATTAAIDPTTFRVPKNARVVRFAPHTPILERAAAVVCHGGMGITQKALALGVPVCVVPFGRDQHEVARHVVVAEAGVRLAPKSLTAAQLRDAIQRARACTAGAGRVAEGFRAAGGAALAATSLEKLLAEWASRHRANSPSQLGARTPGDPS
jgi:MGT family glycosyltransferase